MSLVYHKRCDAQIRQLRFSGNVGDRDRYLQDGRLGDEDAGGRVDAGEEDGQDLPSDGQEHGRKIVARRIH